MSRKHLTLASAALALLLAGCGSSTGTTETTVDAAESSEITVERGPVLGALVIDANGSRATEMEQGRYRFMHQIAYPVTVDGGYIDVNRNGQIDAGEVRLTLSLQIAQGDSATLVNAIAGDEQIKAMLQNRFGIDEEDIHNATPGSDRTIAALSDEIYAYCIENNLSSPADMSLSEMEGIAAQVATRIQLYSESNETVAQLEMKLMEQLQVKRLLAEELDEVNRDINNSRKPDDMSGATAEPAGELSEAQAAGLAFMVEEEKLARDVYNALYTQWGTSVFANIAKSENSHMNAVKSLLEKYAQEVPSTLESAGSFENSELQALYSTLMAQGILSAEEALKVGKLIEETDIADLQAELADETLPDDVEHVYETLLNGSYNHLSAFENQLSGTTSPSTDDANTTATGQGGMQQKGH